MNVEVMSSVLPSSLAEVNLQRIATAYLTRQVDESFEVVNGACYYSKPHGRVLWRFFIRCVHGPIGVIFVDPQTGEVIPLPDDEIRVVREKAAVLLSRQQDVAPLGEDGYILREYAHRQANSYLSRYVGIQTLATNAVFVPIERPLWQFLIEVRLPQTGTVGIFGMIDVDARSGEVIPLTDQQIQQIWRRGSAAAEFCP